MMGGKDSNRVNQAIAMIPPVLETLQIVRYPDPVLRKSCATVTEFGPRLQALADHMLELMREAEGVGLAAPQVGISIRLFVCNVTGEPGDNIVCVNPEFTELSGATDAEEGCLSLPGVTVTVRRAKHAVMKAQDASGASFEITADDLAARAWQHEVDHLDGRLIIDKMSPTDEIANRRALKQLQAERAARR